MCDSKHPKIIYLFFQPSAYINKTVQTIQPFYINTKSMPPPCALPSTHIHSIISLMDIKMSHFSTYMEFDWLKVL